MLEALAGDTRWTESRRDSGRQKGQNLPHLERLCCDSVGFGISRMELCQMENISYLENELATGAQGGFFFLVQ